VFIAVVFFFWFSMLVNWGRFTIVGGTAKHCADQYMVLFRYCSLEGDTAMPVWLHARLCHAFLVSYELN